MATSTTTNYSFPYPLGSDSLSNVALRIQQLAEYIDSTYTILGVDLSSNAAFIQTGDAAGGNLTGTYPNPTISTSVVLPDGTFAVTQSQYDGSTKLATTSYVDTAALNFTLGTIPPLSVTNAMLAGSITYAKLILTNSIVNADVATGAAIAYSKLNLAASITSSDIVDGTIVNADINASAAIDKTKISGTAVTIADTGTVTSTMLLDGTILNADVNASAAIDKTKISGTAVTIADTGTVTSTMLLNGTILNADVNASAAISYSKLNLTGSILEADLAFSLATQAELDAHEADTTSVHGITNTANLVATTDTATVTNAMLAGSIVDTKLSTISTASKVSNSATTATSANTASAIVARDASGNFTAGMITANVTGALTGNASTVTTNANLTGDVTSVGNATSIASGVIVNADVNASAAISYSKLNLATSIVNADVSASAAIAYSKLALTGAILNADLAGSIDPAKVTGTAVVTADSRLSDARTPTAHASTHIPGGTDVLNFSAFSGQGSSLPGSLTLYPAGSLFAVGSAAPYLIYRSNGTSWDQLGASAITTSDSAPASPQAGDLWYQSSTGKQFIRYDSFWVEMGNNTNASVAAHASSHTEGGSDVVSVTLNQVPSFQSYRNIIINGGMGLDQRNAGAAVITNAAYPVDRFIFYGSGGGAYSNQRVVDAVSKVSNYALKTTVTTPDTSLAATDNYLYIQRIEGYNVAHLQFGTANAATVTLSFWVKCSVPGTYSVGFNNGAYTRSYVSQYTVSVANTWEYKSITLTGDLTGTWTYVNDAGLSINWALGMGSTYSTTANSWQTGTFHSVTGSTNLFATNGATWQVTGVQLEAGSVATPFEFEPFETTLRKCQRYFQKSFAPETAPAQNISTNAALYATSAAADGNYRTPVPFITEMRTIPTTITTYNGYGANSSWRIVGGGTDRAVTTNADSSRTFHVYQNVTGNTLVGHWTASAEL